MALLSLLYVSRSTIAAQHAAQSVDQIVATALVRNAATDVTGALLFTGDHFAQVLEGEVATIDQLMADICRDPRHEQILVIDRSPLPKRRFRDWQLAYFGPSQFIAGHVTRLLNAGSPSEHGRAAVWLDDLLWEFTNGSGAAPP